MDPKERREIEAVIRKIHCDTAELALAVAGAGCSQPQQEIGSMSAPPVISQLQQAVAAESTVIQSAITLINGIAKQIADGIAVALAGGATAAQLAPLNNTLASINADASALAAAVQQNTPTPPSP